MHGWIALLSLRLFVKHSFNMVYLFRYLISVFVMCGVVCAQESTNAVSYSRLDEYMGTGMEAAGFRSPYLDEEGNLVAQVYGGYAKVLEGGVLDVSNLRIDVYDKGTVVMTVYAPQCFLSLVEKEERSILLVESEGHVLVEMEQMTVYGRGFRFSSEKNRFEILSESKVLVKELEQNLKGLEL